MAELQINVP